MIQVCAAAERNLRNAVALKRDMKWLLSLTAIGRHNLETAGKACRI
jgi:hypothetical protein